MAETLFPEPEAEAVDPYTRYQSGLSMTALYPYREDGLCRCGCGEEVRPPKRVWATEDCMYAAVQHFKIVKGDSEWIRRALYQRDSGVCASCGHEAKRSEEWEADHVVPVAEGGGGCGLDGFQTLCTDCHEAKTARMHYA